eukprot:216065_1
MGSCDSNCCSDKLRAYNINTVKTQRRKQSYTRLQTQHFMNQLMIHKELCVSPNDITKCESICRILQVLHKYHQWLDDNSLIETNRRKRMREISNFNQYYDDIINRHIYSLELFFSDIKHVKQEHEYTQICRYLNENLESCHDTKCFNMQHCFSQNNNIAIHNQYHKIIDTLQPLTQFHCYIFHTINISQFDIQYTDPINCYIVATFCENIHRQLRNYEQTALNNIIYLCVVYFDGKREKDPFDLLQVVNFIEDTMNKSTVNQIWSKLDCHLLGIDCHDIEDVLLICTILNIATRHKNSGLLQAPKITKWELKEVILPIANWMKNEKMKHHTHITKDEFRDTMSLWLKEYIHVYGETNHGIIVDYKQQCLILKKYHLYGVEKSGDMFFDWTNECIDDYLVFACDNLNTINEKESLVNWMLLNCSKCATLIVTGYISGCQLQFSVPTDVINVLWQFLV